jgi:RND family efflux transporter MFP subunit
MKYPISLMLFLATAACSSGGSEDGGKADSAALVTLARAERGELAQSGTLYGAVERGGDSQATLPAPVEAIVETIAAPAGSAVAAGQVIARLRPSPGSQAQIAAAAADAASAGQAYARAQRLRADGLASDADVETARTHTATAAALARSLQGRSAALVLRAPFAGYVDTVNSSPGDLVQPGTAVAALSRKGDVRARFGVDPATARHLAPGGLLEIRAGDGGPAFSARIAAVDPVADAQTRLASVLVRIPAERGLAPGLPLTASVVTAAVHGVVTVAYAALLDDGGQPFVYVVTRGIAHRHDVATGVIDGPRVAILHGVSAGDELVVAGGTAVEDGMKVRIT